MITEPNAMDAIKGGLIVSCQALPAEPLHSSFIMGRMAKAAMEGGAVGIRANSPIDVKEIQATVPLPLIALSKVDYPNSDTYITPTLQEVRELAALQPAIIALDATTGRRPQGQSLEDFFRTVRKEFPSQLFMADIATKEEALQAEVLGFDMVSTTLSGYTADTKGTPLPNLPLLRELMDCMTIPVIAEGGIQTPEQVHEIQSYGVWATVVGSAITRPQLITRRFVDALQR